MNVRELKRISDDYKKAHAQVERVLDAYARAAGVNPGDVTSWDLHDGCFVIETTGKPSEYKLPLFWAELPTRILEAHAKLEAANRRVSMKRQLEIQ